MTAQTRSAASSCPATYSSVGWAGHLETAGDAHQVVEISRDFLARISPEECSDLPVDCRPRKIVDAEDVVDYAVTLVRQSCAGEASSNVLLQQMAAFFIDACGRLSQLGGRTPIANQ
jgi:hypothetical protein